MWGKVPKAWRGFRIQNDEFRILTDPDLQGIRKERTILVVLYLDLKVEYFPGRPHFE